MPKLRAEKDTPVDAIHANVGVEHWYAAELQGQLRAMRNDIIRQVRVAWAKDAPTIGFAADARTVYAAGIIFHHKRHILLLHRTDGGGWAFPGGGIEDGETAQEAATRECKEELGVVIKAPLVFLCAQPWRNVVFSTFTCAVQSEFGPKLNDEHDAYRWVTPPDALRYFNLHPGVRATLDSSPSLAMDAARSNPIKVLERVMADWGTKWIARFDTMAAGLANSFEGRNQQTTQISMRAAFKKAGFTVAFKPTAKSVEAYDAVVAQNVSLIKSIPEQFAKDVQTQVWQSVMKGGDLQMVTDHIQKAYGVGFRRAAFIAMDQNNKAKATMENVRRQELGIDEAIWQHSGAGKEPRPDHVKAGQEKLRYKLDKGAYLEGIWTWPGMEPRCRCTSKAVIPGFVD